MKITDPHYYLDNVCWKPVLTTKMAWRCRPARRADRGDSGRQNCRPAREQAASDATLPHYDAGGKLMLPTTRDCIFISTKPFTAGRGARSIVRRHHHPGHDQTRAENAAGTATYTQERAEKLIDLLQSKGTTLPAATAISNRFPA